MLSAKVFLATALLVGVSAIPIGEQLGLKKDYRYPTHDVNQEYDDLARSRIRRQAGSVSLNGDGSIGVGAKVPFAGDGKNVLSAIGSANLDDKLHLGTKGIGLAFDNE